MWSVDDALREYGKLIQWADSLDGTRGLYRFYRDFYKGNWPDSLPDEPARWRHAELTATASADAFRQVDPIWCDPPMMDLLAPDGVVIFAKPLPIVWHDAGWNPTDQRLSAITWAETASTSDGTPLLAISGWVRATGIHYFDEPRFAVRYNGLRLAMNAIGPYGATLPDYSSAGPHRLLQTLTALCRAPLVRDEVEPASKAARKELSRTGQVDRPIRRVYLRRPEHAGDELDAARAARAGEPPRGHWVRGHWKNQWHASIGEHRTIWIAGYPRGDFTAGPVAGTKVLIASNRSPND
ncbi:hypothetical protein [Virgisporangium aliadipatigenens]|uniref:hypothetical protein n=1 Tax=Virgisporangium aliadipatigenens TaxID=741659 RepID=UPI00194432F1|nr:hypothetical protein [Virgisporangium aliadipatigenens]